MKKLLIWIFIFTSISYSQSISIDWLLVHNLSADGISELYNLNVEKAQEDFNRVIQIAPNDPRGYFFNCILYFMRFSIERNKSDFDRFFLSSEKVISVCDNILSQNKNDYMARFYLAGIYGYRGLMYQMDHSIVKAVWDGKKGFGMLRDLVEEKPDLYDAYLGTGLFDYLLTKIPKGYAWILKILGYGGNKERGLEELKKAEENGIYTKTEAALYLSQFLFMEEKYGEAFSYIKKLMKQYPENTLFLVAYANMENKMDKPDYAIAAYKKAIEINKRKKINTADEIVYLNYANALFTMNDFKESSENYESYLNKVQNKERISNYVYYRLGFCLDFEGNREKAIFYYRMAKKYENDDRHYDNYIYDICQFYIQNPPSDNFKHSTEIGNEMSQKKYKTCIGEYNKLLGKPDLTPDERLICLYNIGICYSEEKMFTEALNCYKEGTTQKPVLMRHLLAYCYLKEGQMLLNLDRKEEAKAAFNNVYNLSNYHFKKDLERQVEDELDKLK